MDVRYRSGIFTHPGGAAAGAGRVLFNNVDFINFQHDIKTLLMTCAAPSEGESTVVANLSAGLAQAGRKVLLLVVADGVDVARFADGVLLVPEGASSTREAVKKASEIIQGADGRLVVSAVQGLDAVSDSSSYGYGRGYVCGGYYSYADCSNKPKAEESASPRRLVAAPSHTVYISKKIQLRAVAEVAGRVLGMVPPVAALGVHFLDQCMGWRIIDTLGSVGN